MLLIFILNFCIKHLYERRHMNKLACLANNSRLPDSLIRPRESSAERAASVDAQVPDALCDVLHWHWCLRQFIRSYHRMFSSAAPSLVMIHLLIPARSLLNNSFPCLKATSPSFLRPKRKACDTSEEPEWENNETNPKGRGFSRPQLEEAALERSGMTRFDVRISSIRSDCIWWRWRSYMMKF